MSRAQLAVLVLVARIVAAGCGGDTAAADSDNSDAITLDGEEADQAALDSGRADLELTASVTPVIDGTAQVTLQLALLDRESIFDPTVTLDLPPASPSQQPPTAVSAPASSRPASWLTTTTCSPRPSTDRPYHHSNSP